MRIDPTHHPELAVSRDSTRAREAQPYLDADAKVIVATNGCMLVVLPAEIDGLDRSGYVPGEAFVTARKIAKKTRCDSSIELSPTQATVGGITYGRQEGVFDEWSKVLPKKPNNTFEVSLNPHLLARLASSMGVGKEQGITLRLDVNDPEMPISVRRLDDLETSPRVPHGMLMPMRR